MKRNLFPVLVLALAAGIPSFANAQQEQYQKIDQLEETIAQMQAELDLLRNQMKVPPPQVALSTPDAGVLPAPSLDKNPADLRPALDVAPSYPPGQEPAAALATADVLTSPDLGTPRLPTIIERTVEVPDRVIVRYVPVYAWEVPLRLQWEADYGYDCPYRRSVGRPPYSSYNYDYYLPR